MLRFALDSGRAIARMLADTQTAVACSETHVVGPLAGIVGPYFSFLRSLKCKSSRKMVSGGDGNARTASDALLEFAERTETVNVYRMNPFSDGRWDDLVARHPNASAFHERGWLYALARTYGYEPLVITTSPPGERLTNGVVLCRISSWLTGTRLVSLPFADHCEPLLDDLGDLRKLLKYYRYTNLRRVESKFSWESRGFRGIFSGLSSVVLSTAGNFLYKHLG